MLRSRVSNLFSGAQTSSERTSSQRAYRPWGQIRRRKLLSKVRHFSVMMALGIAVLALLALAVVFAASFLLVAIVVTCGLALFSYIIRSLAPVQVQTSRDQDGPVILTRKQGKTWVPY